MIKTTLKIDGMMCGMCEAHINDVIRRNFAVKKVSSSHAKGEAVVVSKEGLDKKRLEDVIAQTGYKLVGAKSEAYEEKSFFEKLFKKN